jgi:uncharacterized protein YndB with AHSA1/START domain
MAAGSNPTTEPADRVLVLTRIFEAPRELVFKAWTEPEHMVRWFGPRGFTTSIADNDYRTGGTYCLRMRGPGGDDHWTQGVYREIVEPERLVMTWGPGRPEDPSGNWADSEGKQIRPETLLTVTFEEYQGKTRLTLHQAVFESVTARDAHHGGWNSSLDRLADYLAAARWN